MTGLYMFMGGNLITCTSKKQEVVSWSIIEAKLKALVEGIMETM